jgi:hypothetical protein
MSLDKMTANEISIYKMTVGKMTGIDVYRRNDYLYTKIPLDKMTVDWMSIE